MNPFIIYGSARPRGNTWDAVKMVFPEQDVPIVDLAYLDLSYFDYDHKNEEDDFIPLMERALTHDTLVLATPTYWYTVSAPMKTFIDRWSDLITIRKDLGRALKGQRIFLITTYGTSHPEHFEAPIKATCDYMDLQYGGCFFHCSNVDDEAYSSNAERAAYFRALIVES